MLLNFCVKAVGALRAALFHLVQAAARWHLQRSAGEARRAYVEYGAGFMHPAGLQESCDFAERSCSFVLKQQKTTNQKQQPLPHLR